MKQFSLAVSAIGFVLFLSVSFSAEGFAAPTVQDDALALVNGEPILFADFVAYAAAFHSSAGASEGRVAAADPSALLQRIINAKLIQQEARIIGLDELPEVAQQFQTARRALIKQMVIEKRLEPISTGEPAVADAFFRQAVRQVEMESALFSTIESATAFSDAIENGIDFQFLAEKMQKQGQVDKVEAPAFLDFNSLLPPAQAMLAEQEVGFVSSPLAVGSGFVVLHWLAERFPENEEMLALAADQALQLRRQVELQKYTEELRSQYSTINQKVLDSLDYGAESSGLDELESDSRSVATIQGGEAITVAELTSKLKEKFFHGFKTAVVQNKVNEEILGVLDRLILERATGLETKRLGIEERPEFQRRLLAREESLLFGVFISKVITPDLEISEEELRAHYDRHRGDYSTPEMMNVAGLGFRRRDDAEAALEKLRQGADLQWMRANSTGQIDPATDPDALDFDGKWLALPTLPQELRDAVAGAQAGDLRFFQDSNDHSYAILIRATKPSETQDYAQVRDSILGTVGAGKQKEALESWFAAARDASEIEILVDVTELKRRLGLSAEEGEEA